MLAFRRGDRDEELVGRWVMEFRWIALIAVWTLLIGPVVGPPSGDGPQSSPAQAKAKANVSKKRDNSPSVGNGLRALPASRTAARPGR
jgi:hypothetical protein